MATSGTYDFSMDIDEVIQEATEMIGGEQTLGHEPKSARRSINLLLQDWQNRGILLWTAGTTAISVSTSVTSYALTSSTIDITEAVVRRVNVDLQTGRPNQYAIRREKGNPVLFLWPIPENTTDILKLEQVKYTEDVTKSAGQNADISRRFLPCLTTGLAYYMAMKRPGIDVGRIGLLKAEYEERLTNAMNEDRERASAYFLPRINRL